MKALKDYRQGNSILQKIRLGRGLSQHQLARLTGMSQQLLSFYEKGTRPISERHVQVLADELQATPNEIISKELSSKLQNEFEDSRKNKIWRQAVELKLKEMPMLLTQEEKMIIQAFRTLSPLEKKEAYRQMIDRIPDFDISLCNVVSGDMGNKDNSSN